MAENRRVEHIIRQTHQKPVELALSIGTMGREGIQFIIPEPVGPKSESEIYEEEVFTEPDGDTSETKLIDLLTKMIPALRHPNQRKEPTMCFYLLMDRNSFGTRSLLF